MFKTAVSIQQPLKIHVGLERPELVSRNREVKLIRS